ncbi:hypothetical protein [Vibrio furnissii]|uniref:hypothetical protein n=1 Tax=Vibrio furnissii TaxID=29494 RepID=UPI00375040FB
MDLEKVMKGEARMAKGLAMMELNGSEYRTITSSRPNIDTPLTAPKKSNGHHKIKRVFGKLPYHYNDALTAAYIVLQEKAAELHKHTYFITVTLDDATNWKLRALDADADEETMIRSVSRWFRAYPYITDAIIVLEECPKSKVEGRNETHRRLHLHIVTALNTNERRRAAVELLRGKSMQVRVQDSWLDERPYTSDDEWEEEDFGAMPVGAVDPEADYWLNTYVKENTNEVTGEITKTVCRLLPVCLRGVDYMTKTMQVPLGRGKNYTFIGLKERTKRREDLARRARELFES